METIYKLLEKYQKRRTAFFKSKEYSFFLKNREILDNIPYFRHLYDSEEDDFMVIRSNIVIHSQLNKRALDHIIHIYKKENKSNKEELRQEFNNAFKNLLYFDDGMNKIYIPTLPKAANAIYLNSPEKLLVPPYDDLTNVESSLVDPFDTFGYQLYNSSFTRLVLIKESPDKDEAAFYHYDTNTIYFLNNQGRLDNKLVLFDRYNKHVNSSHILERIQGIVDAYFAFDRAKLIEELHMNKFISGKMMSIIRKNSEMNDEI